MLNDHTESLPSWSYSGIDEGPYRKWFKRHSKCRHSTLRNKDVEQHSSLSTSSKEKYDTSSKTESEDDELLERMQHAP